MHKLRLVIAEPEPVKMAEHVSAALYLCSKLNNSRTQWAELDIVPTKHGQSVTMTVGSIHDGVRQKAYEHWRFFFDGDTISASRTTVP